MPALVAERYAQNRAAQLGSTTLSPTATVVVGRCLVLLAGCGAAGGKVIASVTDDAGNTWVVDKTATNAGGFAVSAAHCIVTTQLTTSSVITITWSNATSTGCQIWLQEVSGTQITSTKDRDSSGSGLATTTPSFGPSTSLDNAQEIVFALFRTTNNAVFTKGASYTNPTTVTINSASHLEYKLVTTADAVSADGTFSVSNDWVGLLVTFAGSLGLKGTPAIGGEDGSPTWPAARLDAETSPVAVGLLAFSGEPGGVGQPWNQTGAASGQPVIGATIAVT